MQDTTHTLIHQINWLITVNCNIQRKGPSWIMFGVLVCSIYAIQLLEYADIVADDLFHKTSFPVHVLARISDLALRYRSKWDIIEESIIWQEHVIYQNISYQIISEYCSLITFLISADSLSKRLALTSESVISNPHDRTAKQELSIWLQEKGPAFALHDAIV